MFKLAIKKNINYLATFKGWKTHDQKLKYGINFFFYFKLYWCLYAYFRFLFFFLGHISFSLKKSVKNLVYVGVLKNHFFFRPFLKNKQFLLKRAKKVFKSFLITRAPFNKIALYKNILYKARTNNLQFLFKFVKFPFFYLQNKLIFNRLIRIVLYRNSKTRFINRQKLFYFCSKYHNLLFFFPKNLRGNKILRQIIKSKFVKVRVEVKPQKIPNRWENRLLKPEQVKKYTIQPKRKPIYKTIIKKKKYINYVYDRTYDPTRKSLVYWDRARKNNIYDQKENCHGFVKKIFKKFTIVKKLKELRPRFYNTNSFLGLRTPKWKTKEQKNKIRKLILKNKYLFKIYIKTLFLPKKKFVKTYCLKICFSKNKASFFFLTRKKLGLFLTNIKKYSRHLGYMRIFFWKKSVVSFTRKKKRRFVVFLKQKTIFLYKRLRRKSKFSLKSRIYRKFSKRKVYVFRLRKRKRKKNFFSVLTIFFALYLSFVAKLKIKKKKDFKELIKLFFLSYFYNIFSKKHVYFFAMNFNYWTKKLFKKSKYFIHNKKELVKNTQTFFEIFVAYTKRYLFFNKRKHLRFFYFRFKTGIPLLATNKKKKFVKNKTLVSKKIRRRKRKWKFRHRGKRKGSSFYYKQTPLRFFKKRLTKKKRAYEKTKKNLLGKFLFRKKNNKNYYFFKKKLQKWKFKFWFEFLLENWIFKIFDFVTRVHLTQLNNFLNAKSVQRNRPFLSLIFKNTNIVSLMVLFIGTGFCKNITPLVWYLEKEIKKTTKPPKVLAQTQRLFQVFPFRNLFTFKLVIRGKLLREKRMRSKKIIYSLLKPKKIPKDFEANHNLFVAESKARIGVFSTQVFFVYWNVLLNE